MNKFKAFLKRKDIIFSAKYKTKNIPAAGSFLKEEDIAQQLTL